jgi:predicted AAA+ superfamily ATPase
MLIRNAYLERISIAMSRAPVTALLGPRQCGKTTLAGMFAEGKNASFFDLESQPDQARLQQPEMTLGALAGLVVLDEIQLKPELFNALRVLVDRPNNPARFLILGSASPVLIRNVSETLAGRVEFVELSGFALNEIAPDGWRELWVRGGFPRSYLAGSEGDSTAWREGFVRTFLERDIAQLGFTIPPAAMRRFWTMLAHYHGQVWNASEIARSLGVSDKTVRSYLDILTGTYMLRQLQPWYENLGKRQVKAPKIYFRDSGLLHSLLGLPDYYSLSGHPKIGASWEGFVIEQAGQLLRPAELYFWGTHGGTELDLFFIQGGRRYGVEIKYSEAPTLTRGMSAALDDLQLAHLWVVYPGAHQYPIAENITALPIQQLGNLPAAG